jgi:hypothetical protein
MRIRITLLCLALLMLPMSMVSAQNIEFEWTRWDAIINLRSGSDDMEIVETQEFFIQDGTVRFGTRTWTDPVEILTVYYAGDNGSTVELEQSSSEAEGTYFVEQNGGETALQYNLPEAARSGDSFVVQINYVATLPAEGLVDWIIIPDEHGAPIRSSTVTLNFPNGEAPDTGLVRVVSGDASVQSSGNSIIIQSSGEIPSNEMFQIQLPFGEGVGAADAGSGAGSGANSGAQEEPAAGFGGAGSSGIVPGDERTGITPTGDNGLGLGIDMNSLLMLACIFGLMLLFGGGGLMRGLGGMGGMPRGGGIFPGAGRRSSPGPFGGFGGNSGGGRGFRPSSRSRSAPRIRNNKDGGGSAGLG